MLNESGAVRGAGHNAIAVGNDSTGWDYYSQDGKTGDGGHHEHYNTYEEMMTHQRDRYDRDFRVPSTADQDQRMRQAAEANLNNPYSANPFNPNRYHCGDLVNDTMEAGGLPVGEESFGNIPNVAFNRNRRANGIKP